MLVSGSGRKNLKSQAQCALCREASRGPHNPGGILRRCSRPTAVRLPYVDGSNEMAEAALGERLAALGVAALDVAVLRADQRQATVLLADWLRGLTLQDGSATHGIGYDSRHATGAVWAYWLRRVDDGHAAGTEPFTALAGEWALAELDTDLQGVAPRSSSRSGDHHTTRSW